MRFHVFCEVFLGNYTFSLLHHFKQALSGPSSSQLASGEFLELPDFNKLITLHHKISMNFYYHELSYVQSD